MVRWRNKAKAEAQQRHAKREADPEAAKVAKRTKGEENIDAVESNV